jgi:hypothetical protein
MSSQLTALATNLQTTLNLGSGGAEPTAATIQQWLRDGARELWGELPPVLKRDLTITSTYAATLTYNRVFFVVAGGLTLLRGSEWNAGDSALNFVPGAVGVGDTVTAYYVTAPGITNTTTELDSTCIFGDDWLEPLMLTYAEMQAHNRLMNVATVERADAHAGAYRLKMARLAEQKAGAKSQWDAWYQDLLGSIQARMQTGDRPYAEHPAAGFRNRSKIHTIWEG